VKLRDDMLFGHAVLSAFSDDYVNGIFSSSFEVEESSDNLIVTATLDLRCPDLASLVRSGAAGCGYYVICRPTYLNRLVEMVPGVERTSFEAAQFFGTVELRPVVWSREVRQGWRCASLHPEYGGKTSFPEAALLALGEEHRFSVDRARLKPFESIFVMSSDEKVPRGEFRVDPDNQKIAIVAHPETKLGMEALRIPSDGKSILLASVYFPAVMDVLSQLSGSSQNFSDKAWYRIFAAKCAQLGIDPQNSSPLEDAQRLLAAPFNRVDEAKERLFS
jgi:hypothetical protein